MSHRESRKGEVRESEERCVEGRLTLVKQPGHPAGLKWTSCPSEQNPQDLDPAPLTPTLTSLLVHWFWQMFRSPFPLHSPSLSTSVDHLLICKLSDFHQFCQDYF